MPDFSLHVSCSVCKIDWLFRVSGELFSYSFVLNMFAWKYGAYQMCSYSVGKCIHESHSWVLGGFAAMCSLQFGSFFMMKFMLGLPLALSMLLWVDVSQQHLPVERGRSVPWGLALLMTENFLVQACHSPLQLSQQSFLPSIAQFCIITSSQEKPVSTILFVT